MNFKDKKCLAAYFSRRGNNYVSGSIVDLPIGNTEIVAGIIQELTGCDLFRIETVNKYPADYNKCTEVAKNELNANERPELTNHVANINEYDVVFIGFPNWWGTMPMPLFTFLEEYDFSGKTIIPFCTNEGSGMGRSERDIKNLCKKANIIKGLSIHGTSASSAKSSVSNWLEKI